MNLTSYNVLVLVLAALMIWIPWLWRYRIKPLQAKRALNKLLKNHPEAKALINTEKFLNNLYKEVNAKRVSQSERKRLAIQDDAFIYGEIEFLPFFTILDRVKPKPNEIFYDLGSGSGKSVFVAACFFDFSKVCGIELLPGLCDLANDQINKAKVLIELQKNDFSKVVAPKVANIQFIKEDFVNYNFSTGDIIFINATCLSYLTWEKIQKKLTDLKSGSRVIVTTKKIENEQFSLFHQSIELMSWGMNSVNFYIKNK